MSEREALTVGSPGARDTHLIDRTPAQVSDDRLIAGLDLGGTKLAAAMAHRGGLIARNRAAVPQDARPRDLVRLMHELLEECCRQAGVALDELSSVGVSSCGPFGQDAAGALTVLAPNLPRARTATLADCDASAPQCDGRAATRSAPESASVIALGRDLTEKLPNVRILNDAAAALLAERRFGVLVGSDHCAYLTWSTGIGFGLMCDGRLLRGKQGNAGHAGHAVPRSPLDGDPACGCGNLGDVESVAGGAALARAWGDSPASLFAASRAGDLRARKLIERALDAVSASIYNLIVTLDLERVAIGGGLFCAQQDLLLTRLRERVFRDPCRPGLASMLHAVALEPVADPARTAELGALCIVMPADWPNAAFCH